MMSNKVSIFSLLILIKISAVLCSDSNDILQHLFDLEDGSTQDLGKIQFSDKSPVKDLEEFITMQEAMSKKKIFGDDVIGDDERELMKEMNTGFEVPEIPEIKEVVMTFDKDEFKVLSVEEMENEINKGYKVPALLHFAEVEKDWKREEFKAPETPEIKEVEMIIDKYEFKVPPVEGMVNKVSKVIGTPQDGELEILGMAVMSRIVMYVAIVLLVLGAIVCTKFCCRRHHNRRKQGFVRMKDSDKPKAMPV